ncbi:CFI-box-CTERM domain-containing protein [Nitrospirota bacterium]
MFIDDGDLNTPELAANAKLAEIMNKKTVIIIRYNIEVFTQNPVTGTMNPGTTYTLSTAYLVKVADINNDGRNDIVNLSDGTGVDYFIQAANGTLKAVQSFTAPHGGSGDIAIGDIDNSGLNDAVIMSGVGNYISALTDMDGATPPMLSTFDLGTGNTPFGIAIGAFNNDSLDDVVFTYTDNIGVLYQTGSGLPSPPPTSYTSDPNPGAIEAADVNHDGLEDVIVLHNNGGVGVYLNNGLGAFNAEEIYPALSSSSTNTQALSIGDIDRDGLPDIVIADSTGTNLVYLINNTPSPKVMLSRASLDFGNILPGGSLTINLYLDSIGAVDLNISSVLVTGVNSDEFSVNHNCPAVMPSGTSCVISTTFTPTVRGIKIATLKIATNLPSTGTIPLTVIASSGSDQGGGGGAPTSKQACFIATAAYGSPIAPEVETLRQFRDKHLLSNAPGRALVNLYYQTSPPIANLIKERPRLRAIVRATLYPIVYTTRYPSTLFFLGGICLAGLYGVGRKRLRRK